MSQRFLKRFSTIVHHPIVNLVVALSLLFTGLSEVVNDLEEVGGLRIGAHHGVAIFALAHLLQTLADMSTSVETVTAALPGQEPEA